MNPFLESLKELKESENHIEFKEAKNDFNYGGGEHKDPRKRRHCILGYMAALANEGGGRLVFGMVDKRPHEIVGTTFEKGNLGALEDAIYEYHGIRVNIEEHFDGDRRVVVFNVPSRPIGKMLRFEGVPLMRIGESLREMSDEEMRRILNEQEPDFSAKICEGLTLGDLDSEAIRMMKVKYAQKQENPGFKSLPTEQVLRDLELMNGDKLNYASLILLGKQETIHKLLPQYEVVVEYRKNKASITYNARKEFHQPLYLAIDKIWDYLNQPLSNPYAHVQNGPYIYDIQAFNEASVREAILNAVAHRSMQIQSSVVVKQSPDELQVLNPGGFPIGVSKENILYISSTPRSKRLAEVMQKTGLVERSGQGVDKMFANSILDGKDIPSYEGTDEYQVQIAFQSELKYPDLMRFLRVQQEQRGEQNALNVFQLISLYQIFLGQEESVANEMKDWLLTEELIRKYRGKCKLNDKDAKNIVVKEVSERQQNILNVLSLCDSLTTPEISERLSLNIRTVQRELNVLLEKGLVSHTGGRKERKWMVL